MRKLSLSVNYALKILTGLPNQKDFSNQYFESVDVY